MKEVLEHPVSSVQFITQDGETLNEFELNECNQQINDYCFMTLKA